MLIGRNRGHFFLIFLSSRAKLPTPDRWRAKILSPDWLSAPFLHLVGFSLFCAQQQRVLQVLWSLTF